MKIRENHHIIIEKYPYAESLNKKLLDDVKRFPFLIMKIVNHIRIFMEVNVLLEIIK